MSKTNEVTFTVFKLKFSAPLHISSGKDDYAQSQQIIHSDTIYAAIADALAKIHGSFDEKYYGQFTLSSLFPFFEDEEETTYFFPKPKVPIILNQDKEVKTIKKIQWLSKEVFEKLIKGCDIYNSLSEKEEQVILKNGGFYSTDVSAPLFFAELTPRVQVARKITEDAEPFTFEKVYFREKAGLYFLLEKDVEVVEQAMRILQYEGIGTDKTYGYGTFTYEKDEITLSIPENTSYYTNLSLFIPDTSTFNFCTQTKYFSLIKRGGYIDTYPYYGLRKKSIYAFEEGSIFYAKDKDTQLNGIIEDLQPGNSIVRHPVWRNGKSIFIPVEIKNYIEKESCCNR